MVRTTFLDCEYLTLVSVFLFATNFSQVADVNDAKIVYGIASSAWGEVNAEERSFIEFTTSDVYKTLMNDINSAVEALRRATSAVQPFKDKGVGGFIEEVKRDEDRKVQEKKDQLDLLLNNNSKEQKAIRQAEAEINANDPKLTETIQRNRNKIQKLEEDDERKVLQKKYDDKKKERDQLETTIHTVENLLAGLQADFDKGIINIKDKVTAWRDFFPRITQIEAKASINAIKNHDPIVVSVTAAYKGITKTFKVQWTPNSKSKPFDLYKAIGDTAKDSFPPPVDSN